MKALSSGARIEVFDTIDSTSLEAKRRINSGFEGPLWLVAHNQTSGYGRRGSEWRQQEGDVATTFLFSPGAAPEQLPQLSFVAALAVSDAIQRFAPKARLSLKWPNDILAGEGKIAGLLLELLGTPSSPLVALGVGVNIVSAPKGLGYPAARLIDLSSSPPPVPYAFVETLDQTFDAWRKEWSQHGFAPVRAEWLRRAARLGERIKVRLPAEVVEGVFMDLDIAGALILDCDGVRRTISAGAVLPVDRLEKRH